MTAAQPGLSPKPTHGWPALCPERAVLMGVLNVTPNSFSDGGIFSDPAVAVARAIEIEAQGAAILDIGGESTHPKAAPVSGEVERARVLPVIGALVGRLGIPISIDTYRADTARAALKAGAAIVNDIWGLQHDPEMARVVAESGAGVCIMHNRTEADAAIDIIADMVAFFDRSLALAQRAGIDQAAIVLDPGIGFGKTFDQNLIALRELKALGRFGLPILAGASRKGFIGAVTGKTEAADRLFGSIAAHVAAVVNGAAIIRAHDIAEHRDALGVASAILRGSVA